MLFSIKLPFTAGQCLFFAFLCLSTCASLSQVTAIDRIVAIVNEEVITQQELKQEVHIITQQQQSQNLPLPAAHILNKKVLERLIIKKIQHQLAISNGIHVSDSQLNEALHNIASQNQLTLSEFHDALAQDNINFELFRDSIRDEIIFQQLRQRHVDNKINISEQDITHFIEDQKNKGTSNDEYHLAHILLAIPEAASAEKIHQAKALAEDILRKLLAGANFQSLAIEFSDGQQALKGGDLGWRRGIEVPSIFTTALQLIINNQDNNSGAKLSQIIRSSSGFHIIKLLNQRGNERHIISQTLARHILIKTDALTDDMAAEQRIKSLKEQLQKNIADFSTLAKEHSGDQGSATAGGDLGWINPGTMVPAFELALQSLQPGQLSKPIKTRFGWHLIEVLERRNHDGTEDFNRNKVRQQLFKRKAEEASITWHQRLRTEAYVEYRLD